MARVAPASPAGRADRYHHGDLPNALRRAAVDVIDERGLGQFSLREVARRAGVSHTAPAHHFGDVRGLLTSVAAEGFRTLHDALLAAGEGIADPAARLNALGEAYVRIARSHHAHCEVMFRPDVVDPDDPTLQAAGVAAYSVLEETIRAIIDADELDADLDEATWFCWSTIQGLVTLADKLDAIQRSRGHAPRTTGELVRRFTDQIVAGIRNA